MCVLFLFQSSTQSTSPQKAAVDYSLRDDFLCQKKYDEHHISVSSLTSHLSVNVELSEWRDHRILALRNDCYYPGVIKSATHENLFIELDQQKDLIHYSNILSSRKYDVISDASPSSKQITAGSKVCFRCPESINLNLSENFSNLFLVGTVCKILEKPTRFVIKMLPKNESFTVRRADLRLIRPPWWDELEEGFEDNRKLSQDTNGNLLFYYQIILFITNLILLE